MFSSIRVFLQGFLVEQDLLVPQRLFDSSSFVVHHFVEAREITNSRIQEDTQRQQRRQITLL